MRTYPFELNIRPNTPFVNIKENMESMGPDFNYLANILMLSSKALNIVQVGAGGTGGYVAAEIMRFIGSLPDYLSSNIYYTLIDGDIYEPKNLGRQLCTEDDMGQNKAVTLVNNYGEIFNCNTKNLHAIPEYITSVHQFVKIVVNCGFEEEKETTLPIKNDVPYGEGPQVDSVTSRFPNGRFAYSQIAENEGTASVNPSVLFKANNVITLIIDCVDRTTPRKIINDAIKVLATSPKLYPYPLLINPPTSYYATLEGAEANAGHLIDTLFRERPLSHTYREQRYHVSQYNLLVGDIGASGYKTYQHSSGYTRSDGTDIPRLPNPANTRDIFLISSGNGKYTGQVYWGKTSAIEGHITKFKDLFPEIERGDYAPAEIYDKIIGTHSGKELANSISTKWLKGPSANLEDLVAPLPKAIESFGEAFRNYDGWSLNPCRIVSRRYFTPLYLPWTFKTKEETEASAGVIHELTEGMPETPVNGNTNTVISGSIQVKPDLRYASIASRRGLLSTFCSVPLPYEKFPRLIDTEVDAEEDAMSCAERAAQNIQNIQTNKTAAQLVVNYFMQIVNGLYPYIEVPTPLSNVGVSFDVSANTFSTDGLTVDYFFDYDPDRK